MEQTELKQNADFLSIALESLDAGSNDVAVDFIGDVASDLEDENQSDALRGAEAMIEDGDIDDAYGIIEEVNAELMQDIESI